MRVIKKFRNNLFNARVFRVIGWYQYIRFLGRFILHLPMIIRDKNLLSLDEPMGRKLKTLNYRGKQINFDCRFGDQRISNGDIKDGTYTFGFIREIFVRDCYFKHHPDHIYSSARVILDLGVNCGTFSSLMSPVADFIIGVDIDPGYLPVVEHNLRLNGLENFALECAFMGAGGMFDQGDAPQLNIDDLLEKYHLEKIDLVKMDIEGSEYPLFESNEWLGRVGALCMEVHKGYPEGFDTMMRALYQRGFEVVLADQDLDRVENREHAEFLYAWKPL
jgi:hypothetical protein